MSGPFFYQAFGLRFSSPVTLSGWKPIAPPPVVDVLIEYHPVDRLDIQQQWPSYEFGAGGIVLLSPRGVRLEISRHLVVIYADKNLNNAVFESVLAGSCMSALLRLWETPTLHGAAVGDDGQAAVFLADGGTGKSSTAAAFYRRGYRVLTDDLCAIKRQAADWVVQPGLARLKLDQDGIEALDFPAADAVLVAPRRGKYALPVEQPDSPLKLTAIYFLESADRWQLQPLGRDAVLPLLWRHIYRPALLTGPGANHLYFRFCTAISQQIPCFRLARPQRWEALPAVVEAVCTQWRRSE